MQVDQPILLIKLLYCGLYFVRIVQYENLGNLQWIYAKIILIERHTESACVAVLYRNYSIGIGQCSLLRRLGSHTERIVILQFIAVQ